MRLLKPQDYVYKTKPYDHQDEAFMLSRDQDVFALFMEMGTGKSKVVIDTGAWQFINGLINLVIVIAPNGVHRNWITKEIPAHLPDYIERRAVTWVSTPKAAERRAIESIFDPGYSGLTIVAMNVEAFSHDKAPAFVKKLLTLFKVLFVVDESTRIKTPGAKRTKKITLLSKSVQYKRILSGLPILNSPMDLYAQFKFLDKFIIGEQTFSAFKSQYGEWEQRRTNNNRRGFYEHCTGFKNIPDLRALIAPHIYRVKKEDCLDLPPKVYETIYVTLNPDQRRMYDQLEDEGIAALRAEAVARIQEMSIPKENQPDIYNATLWDFLEDPELGEFIKAGNALTKLMRLQQVIGGFATMEDGSVEPIGKTNPTIDALINALEDIPGKVIIWARFKAELFALENAITKVYGEESLVCYHGSVSREDREVAIDSFQSEHGARFFLGNQASGGIGITLTAASFVLYYSNDFSLEHRLQSEDRPHRIGQTKSVTYIDFIAEGTVAEKVIDALQNKIEIGKVVLD